MPQTTVDVDASVLAELRRRTVLERKSIGRLASELLAQQLADNSSHPATPAFRWISRDLGVPRVNPEDKEALSCLLESGS